MAQADPIYWIVVKTIVVPLPQRDAGNSDRAPKTRSFKRRPFASERRL
jgi:hypothetical protein